MLANLDTIHAQTKIDYLIAYLKTIPGDHDSAGVFNVYYQQLFPDTQFNVRMSLIKYWPRVAGPSATRVYWLPNWFANVRIKTESLSVAMLSNGANLPRVVPVSMVLMLLNMEQRRATARGPSNHDSYFTGFLEYRAHYYEGREITSTSPQNTLDIQQWLSGWKAAQRSIQIRTQSYGDTWRSLTPDQLAKLEADDK